MHRNTYDIGVVGGGLAGLSLSILLARKGRRVILFEKENYPLHRVCGEYISMESWDFLISLGVPLAQMNVPEITHLDMTDTNGRRLYVKLDMGGFGISRYALDAALATLATEAGVDLRPGVKVHDIVFRRGLSVISANSEEFECRVVAGSFGKRSNLDVKWSRPFVAAGKSGLNNFIGVKYHVTGDFAADTIQMHLFPNGYCGIVAVGDGLYNLCYLTTAAQLRACEGSFELLEQRVLAQNPVLQDVLRGAKKMDQQPVTISQVSFDRKSAVTNHVLMLGDAAGMIVPLCGNGMSIALHTAKIGEEIISQYLEGEINQMELERAYTREWNKLFAARLRFGRIVQRVIWNKTFSGMLFRVAARWPSVLRRLIRGTHGKPF